MGPFDSSWLVATVALLAPLLIASLGELISEAAGVLNVGLEGMMLMGALWGFWATWEWQSPTIGLLVGAVGGVAIAAVMAAVSIVLRGNQIVVGVGLNLLAAGITTFTFRQIFANRGDIELARPGAVRIPLLADLPYVGRALFDQPVLVYLAVLAVPALWWVLNRTTIGLALRACGEVPAAADTAGVAVNRTRFLAVLAAGAFAGVGGAYLSVVELGYFQEGMVAGRGFLALAAVIFGRWKPGGILAACAAFAAADALQLRLQAEGVVPGQVWAALAIAIGLVAVLSVRSRFLRPRPGTAGERGPIARRRLPLATVLAGVASIAFVVLAIASPHVTLPYQLWRSLPYVLTIAALAGVVGRAAGPASLTVPYRREEDR